MTVKALYPSIRPALDLNFARTKALDPRITFTRASTGTFVGSDGLIKAAASGVARFDHNPITGESLGLLVEEARTNRVWPSQFIQLNAGGGQMWTGDGVAPFVNYATVAPDQTLTAAKIYKRSATPGDYIHLRGGSGGTQTWQAGDTVSCFFKAAELSTVGIMFTGGSTYTLNLSAGTVGIGNLFPFPNGWYRWTYTFTGTLGDLRFYPGGSSYSGDGNSGVFIWGAQGEIGTFPTSYIPTATTTATRVADVASMTGANFSSWYNSTAGTWLGQVSRAYATTQRLFEVGDSSSNQPSVSVRPGPTSTSFARQASGAEAVNHSYPAKFAVADSVADIQGCVNGTLAVLITTGTSVTDDKLVLGGQVSGTSSANAIARLTYWPTRLPDAQLQALTQ